MFSRFSQIKTVEVFECKVPQNKCQQKIPEKDFISNYAFAPRIPEFASKVVVGCTDPTMFNFDSEVGIPFWSHCYGSLCEFYERQCGRFIHYFLKFCGRNCGQIVYILPANFAGCHILVARVSTISRMAGTVGAQILR